MRCSGAERLGFWIVALSPGCIDRLVTNPIAGLGLVSAGVSAPTQIGSFKLIKCRASARPAPGQ